MKLLHPVAGALALVLISSFWTSTVVSELLGSQQAIVAVKTTIPWAFLLLIPALAAAGGSGFTLAKGRSGGLTDAKKKRMPFIAANGILVLVPSALFLSSAARSEQFDAIFYMVQVVELIAGAINIVLLGLNMRDGLRMTGRLRKRAANPAIR